MKQEAGVLEDLYDVIIVGAGVAGLMTALHLPDFFKVLMITKTDVYESNSYLAQGGMAVLRGEKDFKTYFEDTMRAGHKENNPEAVECMIKSSRSILSYLCEVGVPFEKREGELVYTREGAHSIPRIVHYEDVTGKVIIETLMEQVKQKKNVVISPYTTMVDWIVDTFTPITVLNTYGKGKFGKIKSRKREDGSRRQTKVYASIKSIHHAAIKGIQVDLQGERRLVYAPTVVLATGGIGGNYKHSTNYPCMTGDSLALAKKYDVQLQDMDYVQVHPTTFYTGEGGRSFLITEAVRGEGGILLNHKGERFVDELLPRDQVTEAIYQQMEEEGVEHVFLSFEKIDRAVILKHFPNIYRYCLQRGYDMMEVPIPVVPAQHYFMGGIQVDLNGCTSLDGLFAVGETSCTGVHGKNRLASNSLLEAMVFGKRVAEYISKSNLCSAYPYALDL